MDISSNAIAQEILETVPMIMRTIRAELRSHRGPDLSVPQYRSLNYIHKNPGASLSGVAEHVGLTLPSTSKLVDGLVERGLIDRRECTEDRRRIDLVLTAEGIAILEDSYRNTQARLSRLLSGLVAPQAETVIEAMRILRPLFNEGYPPEVKSLQGEIEIEK